MDNNMIDYDPQTIIFRTSDKGIDFLKVHREFEEKFSCHCYRKRKVHETVSEIKRK